MLLASVDTAAAGQTTSLFFDFDTPFSVALGGGQILLALDFGSGEIFTSAGLAPTSSMGGVDSYSLSVPASAISCGFEIYSQAILFGTLPFELSNAQDLVVGN